MLSPFKVDTTDMVMKHFDHLNSPLASGAFFAVPVGEVTNKAVALGLFATANVTKTGMAMSDNIVANKIYKGNLRHVSVELGHFIAARLANTTSGNP